MPMNWFGNFVKQEDKGRGAGGRTPCINTGAWEKDALFFALARLVRAACRRHNKYFYVWHT